MGALSGPGSGVGDGFSSSLPVHDGGDKGICIFKLDLSIPFEGADWSVGLDEMIGDWTGEQTKCQNSCARVSSVIYLNVPLFYCVAAEEEV